MRTYKYVCMYNQNPTKTQSDKTTIQMLWLQSHKIEIMFVERGWEGVSHPLEE